MKHLEDKRDSGGICFLSKSLGIHPIVRIDSWELHIAKQLQSTIVYLVQLSLIANLLVIQVINQMLS